MAYEVIDTFGNHKIGVYEKHEDAIYAIRCYCVQKMMNKVGVFDQDFINLSVNEEEVVYENPIGYYPNKPKFIVRGI
jgi:hypothetical protein